MSKQYTIKELAQLSGKPIATIKSRIVRDAARKKDKRKYKSAHLVPRAYTWVVDEEDAKKIIGDKFEVKDDIKMISTELNCAKTGEK